MVDGIAAVLLLAGNAFFVAVEFSITRARPTMVDGLLERGARGAGALKHAVEHIDNYLSACQLGITICSIGLGVTAEPLLSHALEDVLGEGELLGLAATTVAFVIAYGLVSMAHVVLGELAPKSLAIARTRRVGLFLMPPMRAFYILTKPVVDFFNWLGNMVLRPFGIPPASESEGEPHSEAELKMLIAESERRGLLEPEELQFAEGVFSFGDHRVREVMVPRTMVGTLVAGDTIREAALKAAESGHRRLPLCGPENGLDDPIGVINLSDLTRALAEEGEGQLSDLARPLLEISDGTLLDDLLELMRERHQELALVRDEHGTAVGVVAMEDVIEQILGDIRDEFDPPREQQFERTADGLRVSGEAPLEVLERELGVELGGTRTATVGGWLIERVGSTPPEGEEVELAGLSFRVVERTGPRIAALLITRSRTGEEAEGGGGDPRGDGPDPDRAGGGDEND